MKMNSEQKILQDSGQNRHSEDHDHDHDHGNPFLIPFILILIFSFVEFYTGVEAKSLALLGDAWHMFSDVFSLGIAMWAAHRASKKRSHVSEHTRSELVASIVNVLLMLLVVVWIVVEAIDRFQSPQPVAGLFVMLVALIGLIINMVVAYRLHHLAHHHDGNQNLNQRAALVHVIGDLLGSVAALISGVVIYFTGWFPIDPILSIVISMLLLMVTINLIKDIWATCKGLSPNQHKHHHHH